VFSDHQPRSNILQHKDVLTDMCLIVLC